jgi:hypothetical protein
MNATGPTAEANSRYRQADEMRAGRGIVHAFDEAQINNRRLIFFAPNVAEETGPYGRTPALMKHALKAASRRQIPIWNIAEALPCAGA